MKFQKKKRGNKRKPVFTGATAEKLRDEAALLMVKAGSGTKEAENIADAYNLMLFP